MKIETDSLEMEGILQDLLEMTYHVSLQDLFHPRFSRLIPLRAMTYLKVEKNTISLDKSNSPQNSSLKTDADFRCSFIKVKWDR